MIWSVTQTRSGWTLAFFVPALIAFLTGVFWLFSGGERSERVDYELALDRNPGQLRLDSQLFDGYLLISSAYERLGFIDVALAAAQEVRRNRSDDAELASTLTRLGERPE